MHAYCSKTGEPVYEVPNVSKGGMRATTVADCRKLKLFPSVTEITNLLDKPALLSWKVDKVLQQCIDTAYAGHYINDRDIDIQQMGKEYKAEILRNVAAEAAKAPKIGSEIHDELEQWYKAGANTVPSERIATAVFAVREQVGKYDYVAEKSFCHALGFGGKVDLHVADMGEPYWSHNEGWDKFETEEASNSDRRNWYVESDSNLPRAGKYATGKTQKYYKGVVLDFKTKDTLDIKKFKGYKEHIMQLAAYRHGLGIPHAECYNLFISSQDTKLVKLVEYREEELDQAWEMFKCLLKYWQILNKMEVKIS